MSRKGNYWDNAPIESFFGQRLRFTYRAIFLFFNVMFIDRMDPSITGFLSKCGIKLLR